MWWWHRCGGVAHQSPTPSPPSPRPPFTQTTVDVTYFSRAQVADHTHCARGAKRTGHLAANLIEWWRGWSAVVEVVYGGNA